MTIKVQVELLGVLQDMVGEKIVPLEFEGFTVVNNVISRLANSLQPKLEKALIDPERNNPRPNVLILQNKIEISVLDGLETEVKNGDQLVFIPISHGG